MLDKCKKLVREEMLFEMEFGYFAKLTFLQLKACIYLKTELLCLEILEFFSFERTSIRSKPWPILMGFLSQKQLPEL